MDRFLLLSAAAAIGMLVVLYVVFPLIRRAFEHHWNVEFERHQHTHELP